LFITIFYLLNFFYGFRLFFFFFPNPAVFFRAVPALLAFCFLLPSAPECSLLSIFLVIPQFCRQEGVSKAFEVVLARLLDITFEVFIFSFKMATDVLCDRP